MRPGESIAGLKLNWETRVEADGHADGSRVFGESLAGPCLAEEGI